MSNKARQQNQNNKARKKKAIDKQKADFTAGNIRLMQQRSSLRGNINNNRQMDVVQRMLMEPVLTPAEKEKQREAQEHLLCRLFGETYSPYVNS